MRTYSIEERLARTKNENAKNVFLKILNAPRIPRTQLHAEAAEYVKQRFAEMSEEEKEKYLEK